MAGWLTSSGDAEPAVRDELLTTLIQRRPAVYISCAAILIMSAVAAVVTAERWALLWLAADLALLAWRLRLSFRYDDGIDPPTEGREAVVATMFVTFLIFGFGCAACVASGHPALAPMGIISAIGVFAGLVSRWAAFPRLAFLTIALVGAPVCAALAGRAGGGLPLAAIQFVLIAGTTCAQIMQNHGTLIRMLRAEHGNRLLARTDMLTGLGNRAALHDRLEADCGQLREDGAAGFALLYVDLDGFKPINDDHGHVAGDRLLAQVGADLRGIAGPDHAFRIGGDEFVMLAPGADAKAAGPIAQRVIAAISAPRDIGAGEPRRVMASVGIAVAPDDGDAPDLLVSRADHALYRAKRAGKGRHHFHDDGPDEALRAS